MVIVLLILKIGNTISYRYVYTMGHEKNKEMSYSAVKK